MGRLKYINSSGLTVLINTLTKARKTGGEVMIANVSTKVSELLLITKLNTVFTVTPTVDEALKKISS
jgi:anti-sigma B factor antagonist